MKKLLTFALVGAMLTATGITAFAETTNVSYNVDPSYTVSIPAAVTLDDSAVEADITASDVILEDGKQIKVDLTAASNTASGSTFNAKNGDSTVTYTITGDKAIAVGDAVATFTTNGSKTLTFSAADKSAATVAGTHTEALTFGISVESAVTAVDLSTLTAAYEAQDGDILTGTISDPSYQITIADGATVTLKDVKISLTSSQTFSAITPLGDATIVLDGENYVKGADYKPSAGVASAEGKTLTIRGTGTLTAIGGNGSGIGEGYGKNGGDIVIESGTINATGKRSNPGIGAPNNGKCGNIKIKGGTVTAIGGNSDDDNNAAGIGTGTAGSGSTCECGNITISGGTVTANGSGYGAGIGSSLPYGSASTNKCGSITITSDVKKVTATKGSNAPNSIGVGGINANNGTAICGTITIGGTETGNISTNPYIYEPSN